LGLLGQSKKYNEKSQHMKPILSLLGQSKKYNEKSQHMRLVWTKKEGTNLSTLL